MIIRILLRRLERLDTRLFPPDRGVTEHTIVFVDADGTDTEPLYRERLGLQLGIIDGGLHVPMAEQLHGFSLWIAKDKPEQYLQLIPLEPREIV
jgi:hypothetical protein